METEQSPLYSPQVVEFMTVCKEFCAFLEGCAQVPEAEFVHTQRRLLALLYLKADLLQMPESQGSYLENGLTEEDYNTIRHNISLVMGEDDDYLEGCSPEGEYYETPVLCTVSEELADIYQDIRDCIYRFSGGLQEVMSEALSVCREDFDQRWGAKVLSVLKALHRLHTMRQWEESEAQHIHHCGEDCHCHDHGCDCHHDEECEHDDDYYGMLQCGCCADEGDD